MDTRKHMRNKLTLWVAAGLATLLAGLVMASAQDSPLQGAPAGTAFTFQGQLKRGGEAVDDTCDFEFGLYDAQSGGNQVGTGLTRSMTVVRGLFMTTLDFGDAFNGQERWLAMAVRCGAESDYTPLGSQALAPVPHALYASQVPWSGVDGLPAGFADGEDDAGLMDARAGTGLTSLSSGNVVTLSVSYGGDGSAPTAARSDHMHPGSDITSEVALAVTAQTAAQVPWSGLTDVPGGFADGVDNDTTSFWSLGGNAGTSPATDFLGTTDAQGLAIKTNGEQAVYIDAGGNVGIGTTALDSRLTVSGSIESTVGGFWFPDGTVLMSGIPYQMCASDAVVAEALTFRESLVFDWAEMKAFTAIYSGTYRLTVEYSSKWSGYVSQYRVVVDGVVFDQWQSSSSNWVTRAVDVPAVEGGRISVYGNMGTGGSISRPRVRNARLRGTLCAPTHWVARD